MIGQQYQAVSRERRLGQRLHAFSNMVSAGYYQRTEKPLGVAQAEWRVLRSATLAPGVSQGEIATTEGINVMNVSRAVASLRRKGLLDVEPDPDDRRRSLVSPTPLGQDLGADVAAREQTMYEHLFSVLTPEEQDRLDQLMGRINEVLRSGAFPDPPCPSRDWRAIFGAGDRDDGATE